MNFEEAKEILRDSDVEWEFEIEGMDPTPRIYIRETEIIFAPQGAFVEYETHDNCPECGNPTNFRKEAKEITKEDLQGFIEEYEENSRGMIKNGR